MQRPDPEWFKREIVVFVAQLAIRNYNDAVRFACDVIRDLAWIVTWRKESARREYWDAFYKLRDELCVFELTLTQKKGR